MVKNHEEALERWGSDCTRVKGRIGKMQSSWVKEGDGAVFSDCSVSGCWPRGLMEGRIGSGDLVEMGSGSRRIRLRFCWCKPTCRHRRGFGTDSRAAGFVMMGSLCTGVSRVRRGVSGAVVSGRPGEFSIWRSRHLGGDQMGRRGVEVGYGSGLVEESGEGDGAGVMPRSEMAGWTAVVEVILVGKDCEEEEDITREFRFP